MKNIIVMFILILGIGFTRFGQTESRKRIKDAKYLFKKTDSTSTHRLSPLTILNEDNSRISLIIYDSISERMPLTFALGFQNVSCVDKGNYVFIFYKDNTNDMILITNDFRCKGLSITTFDGETSLRIGNNIINKGIKGIRLRD